MKRNLKTIDQYADETPFTKGQIRFWLFHRDRNGITAADAAVKIHGRLYIDVDRLDDWIDGLQKAKAAA